MIAALILALAASSISGVVHDASGGVVSGAAVIVRVESGAEQRVTTGPDGRFSVDVAEARRRHRHRARRRFRREDSERVTDTARAARRSCWRRPTLLETVTVTPSRTEQRLGDIPASVNVLTSERDRGSRRPSSPTTCCGRFRPSACSAAPAASSSHPTTQGVSLRGIGPSGVSRTLVLLDGVPFNDPFGGWVYWTRVPLESVDRIEVVDGSSSSLYGNYAMGGVINIVTQPAAAADARAEAAVRQPRAARRSTSSRSDVWGKVGVVGRRQLLRHRRLSDRRRRTSAARSTTTPTVKFQNVNGKLDYTPDRSRAARSSAPATSARSASNGKIGEVNDTRWTSVSGGVRDAAARRERSAGERVRRLRGLPQQLPRGDRAVGDGRRAASSA